MSSKTNFKQLLIFWCMVTYAFFCYSEEEVIELTIDKAVNIALQANRHLLGAYEAFDNSDFNLEMAQSAFDWQIRPTGTGGIAGGGPKGVNPTYGAGLSFAKKLTSGTLINFSPSFLRLDKHFHTYINATITQPLLKGFGKEYTLAGVRAAEYGRRAAARNVYINQVMMIVRTITAMYEIVKHEESVKLYQESYERLKGFRDAARIKEKIGLSDPQDVYRAEIELKQAEDHLTTAHERLLDSQDVLRDILSFPMNVPIVVLVPLYLEKIEIDPVLAVKTALSNRMELEQSLDLFYEAQRQAKIDEKNNLPDLNLVLNYSNFGIDEYFTGSVFSKRESTWNIGFTTATEFDLSKTQCCFDPTSNAVDSARKNMSQTRSTVILEVKRALRNLDRTYKRTEIQDLQIKTATAELSLSQVRFNHGISDNFNVIQAEKVLRSAQHALMNAVIDHILGQYQLKAAMGVLADKPMIR